MGLMAGIVGLPNVGKSTLFNALVGESASAAANFPFCTIDPSNALVSVPDERLEALAATVNSSKIVPTAIEFRDIAGLVRGASKGEGLGNKFLSHIRESDMIVQVAELGWAGHTRIAPIVIICASACLSFRLCGALKTAMWSTFLEKSTPLTMLKPSTWSSGCVTCSRSSKSSSVTPKAVSKARQQRRRLWKKPPQFSTMAFPFEARTSRRKRYASTKRTLSLCRLSCYGLAG